MDAQEVFLCNSINIMQTCSEGSACKLDYRALEEIANKLKQGDYSTARLV